MITPDLTRPPWRTSTYSGSNSECVEVAPSMAGTAVRDSKNRDRGALLVTRAQWARFIQHVRTR